MKCATKKLRSPLKWHGGKSYLARRIVALFPPHRAYVEPFLGGGSILLNKPEVGREIVGDLDAGLVNFWQMLRDHHGDMAFWLKDMPYGRETWAHYTRSDPENPWTELGYALAFLVRNRFSRGGLGKDFAWSDRLRGGQPGDVNAWDTIRAELPAIAERVRDVEFHCCDALRLIRRNDAPDALIYCDPPYLHETRTARKAYDHEMTTDQHRELLAVLVDCKGKVFLSGYRNPLYDGALAGWTRHEFDLPNHSGQGKSKQRRIECLWEKP
jgi:DNA adenine methylase